MLRLDLEFICADLSSLNEIWNDNVSVGTKKISVEQREGGKRSRWAFFALGGIRKSFCFCLRGFSTMWAYLFPIWGSLLAGQPETGAARNVQKTAKARAKTRPKDFQNWLRIEFLFFCFFVSKLLLFLVCLGFSNFAIKLCCEGIPFCDSFLLIISWEYPTILT